MNKRTMEGEVINKDICVAFEIVESISVLWTFIQSCLEGVGDWIL